MVVAERKTSPVYKETEIGEIPDEWDMKKIKEFASITTGSRNTQDRLDDGPYPFFVRSQTAERIDTYSYDGEAVLTAGDGVGTGKVFHYINGKFDFHQRVYKISDFSSDMNGYFFYLYFSNNFFERIMQMTAKSSVDSVRMEMIADMLVPIPPKAEQNAIAKVLSDVSDLIRSLEHSIEKKRAIKQGAMQELLTGKRRLPGFSGDWKRGQLGELAKIKTGTRNNQDKVEDGEYPFYVRSPNVETINSYSYDCEAILVPGEGGIGSIVHYVKGRFDVHQRVYAITALSQEVSGQYVFYYMLRHFGAHAMQYTVKATVDSLRLQTFQEFEVFMPPTKEEQTAIATVLSDMDEEIEKLEEQVEKYKRIKVGMMQQLLTGKIRIRSKA